MRDGSQQYHPGSAEDSSWMLPDRLEVYGVGDPLFPRGHASLCGSPLSKEGLHR